MRLPPGKDLNEWLAINAVDFFNQVNLLYQLRHMCVLWCRCQSSIRYAPVVSPRGVASPIVSSNVAARVTVTQPMDTGLQRGVASPMVSSNVAARIVHKI
ncbi:MOB kinase activator-like 1A [Artemisia annua]|uniref:MOB kinase activator-like 1A n=1 Tax=Artemisia annua TaxID=35608 RepID=A0A2U1NTJ9_ARTAN|nr:MOB kinase activator-like 1A [Artemisia annua]